MPKQQILQYEESYNQGTNVIVELIRFIIFEQAQFRNPYFQQTQNLQNPANGY